MRVGKHSCPHPHIRWWEQKISIPILSKGILKAHRITLRPQLLGEIFLAGTYSLLPFGKDIDKRVIQKNSNNA